MKKIVLLFAIIAAFGAMNQASAQGNYDKAIGLRFGVPLAASFKFFVSDPGAIELYAGYRNYSIGYNYFNLGAMYQYHKSISGVDGLSWYFGGGASVWFFSYDFATDANGTGIAINGVLGLDYTFDGAPINLSVDWMPTFLLTGYGDGFAGGYGALSARYILGQ